MLEPAPLDLEASALANHEATAPPNTYRDASTMQAYNLNVVNRVLTSFDLLSLFNVQSTEVISESLLATYQRLNEIPDPKLPVKYPRTPGYHPCGKDNPCNAW